MRIKHVSELSVVVARHKVEFYISRWIILTKTKSRNIIVKEKPFYKDATGQVEGICKKEKNI